MVFLVVSSKIMIIVIVGCHLLNLVRDSCKLPAFAAGVLENSVEACSCKLLLESPQAR